MTWPRTLLKKIAHALGLDMPPHLFDFEEMRQQVKATRRLRAAIRAANSDFRRELRRLEGDLSD